LWWYYTITFFGLVETPKVAQCGTVTRETPLTNAFNFLMDQLNDSERGQEDRKHQCYASHARCGGQTDLVACALAQHVEQPVFAELCEYLT
jgi:hypothetical protein